MAIMNWVRTISKVRFVNCMILRLIFEKMHSFFSHPSAIFTTEPPFFKKFGTWGNPLSIALYFWVILNIIIIIIIIII